MRAKLTLEDHQAAAQQLIAIEEKLADLLDVLDNKAPAPVLDHALQLYQTIHRTRIKLEDAMFSQLRGDPRVSGQIYVAAPVREPAGGYPRLGGCSGPRKRSASPARETNRS